MLAMVGIVGILVFFLVNVVVDEKVSAYQVTLNDATFVAGAKTAVEDEVARVLKDEEKRIGHQVVLAQKPEYKLVLVDKGQIADRGEIAQQVRKNLAVETDAITILVEGKPVVHLADQAKADQVLAEAKKRLVNCTEEETIAKAAFQEEVTTVKAVVAARRVADPEQALIILESGDNAPVKYTVKPGDTLWQIARDHDTRVASIMALNHLEDEDLKLDQELLIGASNPYVTVNAIVEGTKTEAIPYSTTIVADTSISSSYVKQAGKEGEKKITYRATRQNGKVLSTKVLAEAVVSQPVDEIVVQRSRSSRYTMTASRGGSHIGGMIWPAAGGISSGYGARGGSHTGIDINGGSGDPIHAAKAGTVVSAGWQGGYGKMVTISHGNGLETRYAHCSKILVSPGQKVAQGELIAREGSTGNSTGSHLHFEVLKGGTFQNPLRYLN